MLVRITNDVIINTDRIVCVGDSGDGKIIITTDVGIQGSPSPYKFIVNNMTVDQFWEILPRNNS